jgi:hypothetical protein
MMAGSDVKSATDCATGVGPPRVGMLAIVRKRRAIISEVREFDGDRGRMHLVRLDYKDDWRPPFEEVIWELEPARLLLPPGELPRASDVPMPGEDFDALVRAARWSAITPYLDPGAAGPVERLPVCSPFHGAVEIDDYQLVPLLKAMRMPRVNLFLADDVGLGKTIEAGLILSELLIRRRVNRIVILTPASLCIQWRDEMWSKFSLPFEIIDRNTTVRLRRSFGIDTNPWRCCTRIIASYHYLRQPDVLEQFLTACKVPEGSPRLPWDLLIVDEVHNLMPSPFGEDSQLCRMLRLVAPQFEHRLFLTATPHNGHTRSFTGLLEMLDPVRFSRTDELRPAERERIRQVVIRRLKREINARTTPPRFCHRMQPQAIVLSFSHEERQLIRAFEALRAKVRGLLAGQSGSRRLAGRFAIEVLGKRMLSGPVAFLESWRRCKMGLAEEEPAEDKDVLAARQAVQEETADDREAEQRGATAATIIGAWLKPMIEGVREEIALLDRAAQALGIDLGADVVAQDPISDARLDALCALVERLLRTGGSWRDDERLVVFTEYKTTLDYLLRRLRQRYVGHEERFLCLYGGMEDLQREMIKEAFNDPASGVRVLLATDAAAEGLNLQSTARYLLHFDCPWNPARLEQRNGRLDRHGQARDVHVFHFASQEDADLKFLAYLITKVDQIREDLGATGELFDEATHRRLIQGEDVAEVQRALEGQIAQVKQLASIDADVTVSEDPATGRSNLRDKLEALAAELDFDPLAGQQTLEAALAVGAGRPQLTHSDDRRRFALVNPDLPGWKDVIDQTIRKQTDRGILGPVPSLSFSVEPFLEQVGPRRVFRPRSDVLMLHLGHPMVQRALTCLARRRFPGPGAVSRWTVRLDDQVPPDAEALILLHVEELAVNQLRETFHHWVRTVRIPVVQGRLGPRLPHVPAKELRTGRPCTDPELIHAARRLLDDLEPELRQLVGQLRSELTDRLQAQLMADGQAARAEEERRYQSRLGEISTLIAENTIARLEREIDKLKQQRSQGRLFAEESDYDRLDRNIQAKQEELQRRQQHYEEVRQQLAQERERIVKFVLPRRYALVGQAQVFPVAVEVRLPMTAGGGSNER